MMGQSADPRATFGSRDSSASETRGDTLSDPGRSFTYDFNAFDASGEPVSVKTTERVHHVNASYSPTDPGETIETVEYSDGMGRTVQTRVQAEDLDFGEAGLTRSSVGDAVGSSPSSGPRVRVTGWTRYNNKGDVVEKWEPFFSEGFGFESVDPSEDDASITMHYDAKGRKVRTVRPDGGESRVVFGVPGTIATPDVTMPETVEPTPWEQYTYDANDNGGRTNISDVAESGFSGHFDTPTSVVQDARGRAIETTERNGPTSAEWHTTQTDYDIRGNVTKVTDARGNVAAEQVFDLADQTIRTESIDAGASVAVFDAAGTSIEARDAKGGLTLKAADDLLRPTKVWGRDTDASGEAVRLVEETLYGDGPNGPSSPADTNHLGKPYRAYDEAGRVETDAYDFKGNVLETTRRVIDPQLMIDAYQAADSSNNWSVDTYRVDWSRESGETRGDVEAELLKAQDYTTTKAYDGLDGSRQVTYPEDKSGSRKVLEPTYNKAGSLQAVDLDGSTYVEHIAYNPKGQRILAALGCGVMTRYDYDDESMRLVRLRSEGYTKPDSTTYAPDGTTPHQDFSYTYDGVGNVTQIDSSGNNVGIGGTNSLTRTFEYDPLYRLTEATGREYAANPSNPWDYMPAGGNANDPNQTRAYSESYDYDPVGNMTKLTHDYGAGSGTWTRDYVTESTTNRLDQMTSAGGTHQYDYDRAGNLTSENTDRKYEWDARGRMRSFRNQVSCSQATVFAHYTYDGGGQRVQKVVSKDSGKPVHSVYIGGIFEHHERIDAGSVEAEVNHLHVMDDQKRVAIERIGSELDGSNPPTTQYYLGDHLQSSNVVLDDTGTLFNREEYRPFGESSFGSYATKRYRFTGQERDEESSLSYHGARYYAPWTAQWTSPDPKGMVDGTNLYGYSRNNPIRFSDPTGTEADSKSIDGAKPTETNSSSSRSTSEEQEEENPSFWERLGAGFRTIVETITNIVGSVLHNLIRIPKDIALGFRRIVKGFSNIFGKGHTGKGFGQIFFGLLELAGVRLIADPALTFLGGFTSAIQTFAGVEPPGQSVSKFIEQKEKEARSKGPEAMKEFRKQKQKLYNMYGEETLEQARIKTGAGGLWALIGAPVTFGNTIMIPSKTTSLRTLAHEMSHVGQHARTGMRYASRSLTVQSLGEIQGSRNYAYQYQNAEASKKPWSALNPEQRAAFMEWSWETGLYGNLWPAQGGSGRAMWRKHITSQ